MEQESKVNRMFVIWPTVQGNQKQVQDTHDFTGVNKESFNCQAREKTIVHNKGSPRK